MNPIHTVLLSFDFHGIAYKAKAKSVKQKADLLYEIVLLKYSNGYFSQVWTVFLQKSSCHWDQTMESIQAGPSLPTAMIQKIGVEIERQLTKINS